MPADRRVRTAGAPNRRTNSARNFAQNAARSVACVDLDQVPAHQAVPTCAAARASAAARTSVACCVPDHRALAARVVDEPARQPELQHALRRRARDPRRRRAGTRDRTARAPVYCRGDGDRGDREPAVRGRAPRVRRRRRAPPTGSCCGDALAEARRAARDGSARRDLHRSAVRHRHRPARAAAIATPTAPTIPTRSSPGSRPLLEHSRRVLAPHGSLFVHLDYRAVHYVKVALDRLFGRDRFVNEIVWCYAVGGKSRRGFGRKHDTILWYARSDDWAFYPDAVRVPRRGGSHMRVVLDGWRAGPGEDRSPDRPGLSLPGRGRQGARGLVDRHRDAQPLGPRAHRLAVAEAGAAGRADPARGDRSPAIGSPTGSPARGPPRPSRSGSARGFVTVDREPAAIERLRRPPRARRAARWRPPARRPRRSRSTDRARDETHLRSSSLRRWGHPGENSEAQGT